jgi:FixJ family two-component response regulator
MPNLDGIATLERLREMGIEVPVLLSSGYGNEKLVEQHEGLAGFIGKPYKPAELHETLRRIFGDD